jgi:iron complex outermembrane receptor protein
MPVQLFRLQRIFLCLALLFAGSLGSSAAFAQSATGQVVDPSGAAVANAQVTLTSDQSHAARQTSTNPAGRYSFSAVRPGAYTLTVEAGGFAEYQQTEIKVAAGQNVTLTVRLTLESASQSVTVKANGEPLQQVPTVGKTGTEIEDLPTSVQIISRELVDAQGGIELKDAIRNSSGVVQGGSDGFGFGDKFQIRGLEARIYNDGFSDGDERNGIPHSLNGVERVEILEGPGSSLFGSGPPGGTINMVHFAPSSLPTYGGGFQTGSFGLYSGNAFVTGPTAVHGLDYRVDGLAQHEDGFRALTSADYELRPVVSWSGAGHVVTLSADARALQATPDPAGLIYLNGSPIAMPRETKYSTPFSLGDQSLERSIVSDIWTVNHFLTVTNRFSNMYRNLSILRNGDGGTVTGTVFSGRQLRKQHDVLNDVDYEAEPVFRFRTKTVGHTLLTGFEAQHQSIGVTRTTADLPNITNIFAPVIPESSTAGLVFLQDAEHSGFQDQLRANYFGLYATDQIDVTNRLKVRLSGRQDWWNTELLPQVFVPGRILTGTQLIEPPNTYSRHDTPFSWSAGAAYRLLPRVTPYFGVAKSNLVNFSSEATQNGVQAPESGLQYEAGVKAAAFGDRVTFTAAGFDVKRNNVFTLVGDMPVFNDQKTDGGEANVQALLTRRWKISANGTGQHAWLVDNPSSPAATGKRPVGVPQHIFNLWTTYDLKVGKLAGFTVGGGLTNRDRMFGDVLNTKSVPSYTTVDAVASYTATQWNASVGVRNLADTRYFVAANGGGGFVGEPRSYFIAVKRTFGAGR